MKDVPTEPYALAEGYEWSTVDLAQDDQAKELYELLLLHYVEDTGSHFRFAYPIDFLRWALLMPGFIQDWHLGVRATKSKKLVGFISGIPLSIKTSGKCLRVAEINFLCVHKKLREKRLAPILIREITRRVNLTNVWQAIYTAGIIIPKPIAKTMYFHRLMNTKKLLDVGFSSLPSGMPVARYMKIQKMHDSKDVQVIGTIKPMEEKHHKQAYKMLMDYLKAFKIH